MMLNAPRVIARQLDRGLDRLCPRVREERPRAAADRRDLRERLAERDLRLVIVVGGDVQESRGLVGDRADDVGMRMARRGHGNAGAEIQIDVAVDVFDDRALAARHHERRAARIGRRHDRAIALENRPRAWARRGTLMSGTRMSYRRSGARDAKNF